MEYFVYILFSHSRDRFYIGSTSELKERVIRHNQNNKGFTGKTADWEIVYTETYGLKEDALKRELQIKKWKSRTMIKKLITDSKTI